MKKKNIHAVDQEEVEISYKIELSAIDRLMAFRGELPNGVFYPPEGIKRLQFEVQDLLFTIESLHNKIQNLEHGISDEYGRYISHPEDLIANFADRRKYLGISQTEMASRLGISRNYLSQIELDPSKRISYKVYLAMVKEVINGRPRWKVTDETVKK